MKKALSYFVFRFAVLSIILLVPTPAAAAQPVTIGQTGHVIIPPQGWSVQTNQQTGMPRLASPDGMVAIDINPREEGTGLDGKGLLESKSTMMKQYLDNSPNKLTRTEKKFWNNGGVAYMYEVYQGAIQGQPYVIPMIYVYSGAYSFMLNSAIPAYASAKYLNATSNAMKSLVPAGAAHKAAPPSPQKQTPPAPSKPGNEQVHRAPYELYKNQTGCVLFDLPSHWIAEPQGQNLIIFSGPKGTDEWYTTINFQTYPRNSAGHQNLSQSVDALRGKIRANPKAQLLRDKSLGSLSGIPVHAIDYNAEVNNAGHYFRMLIMERPDNIVWLSFVIPNQYLNTLKGTLDKHYDRVLGTMAPLSDSSLSSCN